MCRLCGPVCCCCITDATGPVHVDDVVLIMLYPPTG